MKNLIQSQTEKYTKEHKKKRVWHRSVTAMASVVVFCTTYALILPAITWERSLVCEIPEHLHDDSCYETVTMPAQSELVCIMDEHEHDETCYVSELVCGVEESDGHVHDESCYCEKQRLVCLEEESDEHTHSEDCYETVQELVCGMDETIGHVHTDECYENVLVCEIPEHVHGEECYEVVDEHTEEVLVCELEEHEHTASCFDAPPAEDDGYYCGQIEHIHSEEQCCYFADGTLKCTIPEHTHTLACESNPNADVEDKAEWESTFADVSLSGNWAEDVVAVAETQIGYSESTRNFEVQEDGITVKGYTRYGDWYGNQYVDWDAVFCSFCLYYAGVSEDVFPLEQNSESWVSLLSEKELYHEAGSDYLPKPGDLIFFDRDEYDPEYPEARKADHVGIVYRIEEENIITIEGDWEDCVCFTEHTWEDDEWIGCGEVPIGEPEPVEIIREIQTIESEPAADGAVAEISGNLPVGATVAIEAVELSEEELIEYFGEAKASAMTGYVAYDITIWVDGEEWQPDDTVSVVIKHPDIAVEDNNSFAVAHVDGETDTVSDVAAEVNGDGDITFEAEGFSTYIIYTVEFWYGEYMYSINGHSELLLSELFIELGIDADVSNVVSVEFSDPSLITVEQTEADWKLITEVPFLTEENLTVILRDDTVLSIRVTDEYAPVVQGGNIVYAKNTDSWYSNNKLRSTTNEYAYFYHSNTRVNYTTSTSNANRYTFTNNAPNSDRNYDTIEFRNAYCYPNNSAQNPKRYNICVKVTLNNVPSGTTIRWGNQNYLSRDGSPFLSIGRFYDGNSNTSSLAMFDISWEMWLEDPNTYEKITYIPLMGGSCYVGDEYVTVYSTDNTIYTNFPTSEFNANSYNTQNGGWFHRMNDYDSPNNYILGVVGADGVVKGRYISPWNETTYYACELTANLYELPIMVSKSVSGENSGISADTQYRFRAGFNDPFNNDTFTYLGGHRYTIRNANNTTESSGTLPTSGEFSLKAGQTITIDGLQAINVPVRIEEFTAAGTHTYDYYEYLEGTTAVVNGTNVNVVQDQSTGTRYIQYNLSEATNIAFTNTLKKEAATLTITKDVVGATTTQKFPFTATVTDGNFVEGEGYEIVDNTINFELSDNQSITLNVTPDATVTVTETGHDGFFVKFKVDDNEYDVSSYDVQMNANREITVTNTAGQVLPSTGGMGRTPFYIAGVSIQFGALIYVCELRRKRKGGKV